MSVEHMNVANSIDYYFLWMKNQSNLQSVVLHNLAGQWYIWWVDHIYLRK